MSDDEVEEKHLELLTDVFGQFMTADPDNEDEDGMYLETSNLQDVLVTLDLDPTNEQLVKMVQTLDPDDTGRISFEPFVKVMSLKLEAENVGSHHDDQLVEALRLFTDGEDREITLQDLRRVAKEVKDNPTDEDLRQMMMGRHQINLSDFADIMKRAKAL